MGKNFRIVPEYPWLEVSEDGEVKNLLTETTTYGNVSEKTENTKYLCAFSYHVHRLVALAWLDRPDGDVEKFTVNHKDGIKKNNNKSNLEWCTVSQNAIHAYVTGLRNDNTPILVKDLRDNNIQEFYSLQECARHFNKNGSLIHQYLKNPEVIRFEYYVFIRKGQDWPNLSSNDIGKDYQNKPRPVIATHIESGEQFIANSISHAATILGISKINLRAYFNRGTNKPYHGYVFKEVDDLKLREELLRERWSMVKATKVRRKPLPIDVLDEITGQTQSWDSVEQFANSKNSLKNSVQKSMLLKQGRWKNYLITYKSIQTVMSENESL